MTEIAKTIFDELHSDLIYHAWIVQGVAGWEVDDYDDATLLPRVQDVLRELLLSEDVEVGETSLEIPDHVSFIAWRGTIEERIARAMKAVDSYSGDDKNFAYWLALRKNIDRYEDEELNQPPQ